MQTRSERRLIQISSGYFCAGVVIENDLVIEAAPIVMYMKGWSHERVISYCRRKHWLAIDVRI